MIGQSKYTPPNDMASALAVGRKVRAALRRGTSRPLAIEGPSGAGKTRLLRGLAAEADPAWWCSAKDLVEEAVEAMRGDRYPAFKAAVATDTRPLMIEHIEDLRAKPQTRAELRRVLLLRAAEGGATILTLTAGRGRSEMVRWLGRWAEVVSLDRPRPQKGRS